MVQDKASSPAEDPQPESPSSNQPAAKAEGVAGQPVVPGGPGDTTQATGINPAEEAEKKKDDLTKEVQKPSPMAATEGPIAVSQDILDHQQELSDATNHAIELQGAKDLVNEGRLLNRQARRDGDEAMDDLKDTNEKLRVDAAAQGIAHAAAQARAAEWVAPTPVAGRMTEVKIILHPEDPAQRAHTIHIRVLGEVDDGYVTVFRDGDHKNEVKEGRVAESPRFGTKNRVYVKTIEAETGKTFGEVTHPGYFDWPPLRMNPGKYTAKVITTGGKELASVNFEITGVEPEDLSEKNSAGPTVGQRAVIQSSQAARAQERSDALTQGTKLPDSLTEEDVLGDLVGSKK